MAVAVLPVPAEMMAMAGLTMLRNAVVVEVSLPWWATLSTMAGESDAALISACWEGSSISPVNSAENLP